MMDLEKLRQRYLADRWSRQMGNLASTLARLGSRAGDQRYDVLVANLLRESTLLIEWSTRAVPLKVAAELAMMQRELVLWHRIWPNDAVRRLLAFRVRQMSDRLLLVAGLLNPALPG
jgi:hypothetical protein